MSWRELLLEKDVVVIRSPWLGGRSIQLGDRAWTISGRLPTEMGWFEFDNKGRSATLSKQSDPNPEILMFPVRGYLVGDLIAPDNISMGDLIVGKGKDLRARFERVHLIEPGLVRFSRISAGRAYEGGPLVFRNVEMPIGPEEEMRTAFEDQIRAVRATVKGVTPALDAAFQFEWLQLDEAEARRKEIDRIRREEEAKRQAEERRKALVEKFGDGAGRREVALVDFKEAAKAALGVSGAVYLDHRVSNRKNEMVVKFRLGIRRFECVCDARTLQIIDAGICLTAHDDDRHFEGGTKGDTFFTLESLPAVILEAERAGKLVVWRH